MFDQRILTFLKNGIIRQFKLLKYEKFINTSVPFNSIPNDKILDLSKLKAYADDKINVTKKLKFKLGRVENIAE